MHYAKLLTNDTINCEKGICVSLFLQGCPHHCKDCFNPETWNFNDGIEITQEKLDEKILSSISANNIIRNFSILGGEPLALENLQYTAHIVNLVRKTFPKILIYIWTGYTLKYLKQLNNNNINNILNNIDCLIDGPFISERKNLKLKLRGSDNQKLNYREQLNE